LAAARLAGVAWWSADGPAWEWPEGTPDEMEAKAHALVEYANQLPKGVTTEAVAEASNLRRKAAEARSAKPADA
jgi:hypothetical protein